MVQIGGYPGVMSIRGDTQRRLAYIRDSIVEPAIGKDISALGAVRKPALLRQIFAVSTSRPAEIVALQKLQGQLQDRGAIETVAHYLDLLQEAYLIAPLQKYSRHPARGRAATPKLVTLSNALLAVTDPRGIPDMKTKSERRGHWIENVCLAHAWNSGQQVRYWREEPLEVDGIIDGIIYAGMVGLGFAMTENVLYYGRAVQQGPEALTVVFVMRGMAAPFFHPLATGMTGIGLGWSRQSDNGFVKVTAPVLGFMLAVLIHGTWNGFATYGSAAAFFAAYFLIMGPAFIATLMVIAFSLRREGRIVRQYLYPDFRRGFFDPQEYERLCSVRGRIALCWNAFTTGGFSEWRKRKRFNQLASELAFHRSRVNRRLASTSQMTPERDQAYLVSLLQVRQQMARGSGVP